MRKKLSVALVLLLSLSLAACSDDAYVTVKDSVETSVVSETVSESVETSATSETVSESTEISEASEPGVEEEATVTGELQFNTFDIYANPVNQDVILGSKLVIMNLWEPWCGPCVGEMPDLQKLYENYKDKGLLILGVYTTFEMDGDAMDIVDEFGITYPILRADSNLINYEQEYVPATFLFDGKGNRLQSEPMIGSQDYDAWEKVVKQYLE